jgi:hypothetical protein
MNALYKITMLLTVTMAARGESSVLIPPQTRTVSALLQAETSRPAIERVQKDRANRAWKISLIPVLASQLLDTTSSYGMRELNPMLAGPDGRFGAKAAGIKFGATAAILGIEYLVVKKYPGAARTFSKLNWAGAAVTSSFAVHNYSIR